MNEDKAMKPVGFALDVWAAAGLCGYASHAGGAHRRTAGWAAMTAVLVVVFGQAVPASAAIGGYEYDIHTARPEVSALGGDISGYDSQRGYHVVDGDDITMVWRDRDDDRSPYNAHYVRYWQLLGVLVPRFPPGTSAKDDQGWRWRTRGGTRAGVGLIYDAFATDFKRGDNDRTVAGQPAKHYVLTADYTVHEDLERAEIRHEKVIYNLWVWPDKPYSWAYTAAVRPDRRVAFALQAALRDHGMVARVDTSESSQTRQADQAQPTAPYKSATVAWVSDVRPIAAPKTPLPVVQRDRLPALRKTLAKLGESKTSPGQTCRTTARGDVPAIVKPLLRGTEQRALQRYMQWHCKAHPPRHR